MARGPQHICEDTNNRLERLHVPAPPRSQLFHHGVPAAVCSSADTAGFPSHVNGFIARLLTDFLGIV